MEYEVADFGEARKRRKYRVLGMARPEILSHSCAVSTAWRQEQGTGSVPSHSLHAEPNGFYLDV